MNLYNITFFLFLYNLLISIISIYIVHTDDNILHFIKDQDIVQLNLAKINKNDFISNVIIKHDCYDILPSLKSKIDSVKVSKNGMIFFNNKSFSIENLVDKPKLISGIIFQTQKKYTTVIEHGVIIFLVSLYLNIIDSVSLYTRSELFLYIYYPFESNENIVVDKNIFILENETYNFKSRIIAVYDTIYYNEGLYMRRIFDNFSLQEYRPYNKKKKNLTKFIVPIIIAIYWFFFRSKKVKIISKEYETEEYSISKGFYNNMPVLVKNYKDNNFKEIDILTKIDLIGIPKILYFDSKFYRTFCVFEYSDKVNSLTITELKQYIDLIQYFIENKIYFKNFNPINIRRKNNQIKLLNLFNNDWIGWYPEKLTCNDQTKMVISVGIIIHYFLTGFHPFDNSKTVTNFIFEKNQLPNIAGKSDKNIFLDTKRKNKNVENIYQGLKANNKIIGNIYQNSKKENNIFNEKNFINENNINQEINHIHDNVNFSAYLKKENYIKLKKYNKSDTLILDENLTSQKYLIRFSDPLRHDLIYHTVKQRTTIRKLSKHPFFWSYERIFLFLANYSDVLEGSLPACKKLERNKSRIFNSSWISSLDTLIKDELNIFRNYNYNNAKDLVRVIRNMGRHYNQIPEVLKEFYGQFPRGFVNYWTTLFPGLLIVCYNCGESLKENELLSDYY